MQTASFVDVAQCHIGKTAFLELMPGNGEVGGLGHGIAVKHADLVGFHAFRLKTLQKSGAVHSFVATAVDAAVQLRKHDTFNLGFFKYMHIVRPGFLAIRTVRTAKIMVARGDDHRDIQCAQSVLYTCHRVPGGNCVKNISGDQQKITVFLLTQSGDLVRDLPTLFLQGDSGGRLQAHHGGIQMPVGGVQYFNHKYPPSPLFYSVPFPYRW